MFAVSLRKLKKKLGNSRKSCATQEKAFGFLLGRTGHGDLFSVAPFGIFQPRSLLYFHMLQQSQWCFGSTICGVSPPYRSRNKSLQTRQSKKDKTKSRRSGKVYHVNFLLSLCFYFTLTSTFSSYLDTCLSCLFEVYWTLHPFWIEIKKSTFNSNIFILLFQTLTYLVLFYQWYFNTLYYGAVFRLELAGSSCFLDKSHCWATLPLE